MHRFGLALVLAASSGCVAFPVTAAQQSPSPPPATCLVRISEVRDVSGDPGSMGELLNKTIRDTDVAGWVRSGLGALAADQRIHIAGDAVQAPDLVLDVDLVKAYLGSQNMAKTANVVLRVNWRRADGGTGVSVYRGSMTSINWIGGKSEIRGAFDLALSSLTGDMRRDVLSRCAAMPAPNP